MDSRPPTARFDAAELAKLRGLARRLADPEDAEDLVHDAWIAAKDANHDGGLRWWRTVLRRRRAMQHRSNARRIARETRADLPAVESLQPEHVVQRIQMCEALEAALEHLDPRDRSLIVRRYCEGRSAAQLSTELGISASTLRTRLSRSLQHLRAHLDRRYGDRGVWLSAVLAWSPPTPAVTAANIGAGASAKGALAMSSATTMKIGGAATAAILCLAAAWTVTASDGADEVPPAPVASRSAPAAPTASSSPDGASKPASADRQRWTRMRDAITARRARTPPDEPEASVLDGEDPDEILAAMREEMAKMGAGFFGPGVAPLMEQAVPLFVECLGMLPESATGKLHLRANVIGEPDVGAIVESIEVVDNSLDQPEFSECLQESTYSIAVDAIEAPVSKSLNIQVDMQDRSLNMGTELDLEQFSKLAEENPEVWEKLLADADTRQNFAELLENPAFVRNNAELAAHIEDALANAPATPVN